MSFIRIMIFIASIGVVASSHQVSWGEQVKVIDRRTDAGKSDASVFFILFLARGVSLKDKSFSGHAFVSLCKDDATAQACSAKSFGVYPKQGIGWFGPVPAKMVQELWKPTDFRLIVKVDRVTFDAVDAFRKRYINDHSEGKYELGSRDCVTFTAECARLVGLKIPERRDAVFPATFVAELLKMN